jgi:DNA-binding LacI/PurR family transcriptional regulator
VRAAAAHLGYSPNVIAQTLKRPYAHTIALGFFPENGSTLLKLGDSQFYFFMGVLQAIERESAQLGFDILLPPRPAHSPHEYVQTLQARKVAGAIMVALHMNDQRIQAMLNGTIPTVFVDVAPQGPHITYVASDHMGGSRQATEHLLQLGHRRIAFFGGHQTSLSGTQRFLGYHQALESAGIPLDPDLVRPSDFNKERAHREMLRLLDERQDFTAVLAASDFVAFGILRALHERGVRVPEEISLIGFDDIDLCLYVEPHLTTIHQDAEAIGRGAVERLIQLISGDMDVGPLILPTHLVARQSTGLAPS